MTDQQRIYDVIIVGAGVVGSLCARELARYQLDILLLDKHADVGEGTTKANTAIVHAGYDAKPGSLKARLNLAGNAMFDTLCAELEVDFDRCGTYVVGPADDQATLLDLQARGRVNGVPGLEIISGDDASSRAGAHAQRPRGPLCCHRSGRSLSALLRCGRERCRQWRRAAPEHHGDRPLARGWMHRRGADAGGCCAPAAW